MSTAPMTAGSLWPQTPSWIEDEGEEDDHFWGSFYGTAAWQRQHLLTALSRRAHGTAPMASAHDFKYFALFDQDLICKMWPPERLPLPVCCAHGAYIADHPKSEREFLSCHAVFVAATVHGAG